MGQHWALTAACVLLGTKLPFKIDLIWSHVKENNSDSSSKNENDIIIQSPS